MKIEWLTTCETIERGPQDGPYTLSGLGKNGFLLEHGHLGTAEIALMVCFLVEDEDEPGDTVEIWHRVIGPEGTPVTATYHAGVQWVPRDSTQKIDPEMYYLPLSIQFDVDVGGPYTIEIGTTSEEREVSLWVEEIDSLD